MTEDYNDNQQGVEPTKKEDYLPWDKIVEIINTMDFEKTVRAAYQGWVFGQRTGVALIDLCTGDLKSKSIGDIQVEQYADKDTVAIYKIDADDNIIDEEMLLPMYIMRFGGLITEQEYNSAKEKNDPEFIKSLRQRYLDQNNFTIEEYAIHEIGESGEMDWDYIYYQLKERYK